MPDSWVLEEQRTIGPFVTRERYRLPDGSHRTWSSRRRRKTGRTEERRSRPPHPWWRPKALGWWIAALFMVGSLLFALGSFPPYANGTNPSVVGVTYFVGSIFFTSASFSQLLQAQTPAMTSADEETQHVPAPVRFWAWLPHDRSWLAAVTQFPGTLFFNLSTAAALAHNLTVEQQDEHVWRASYVLPTTGELVNSRWSITGTLLGAVCFLVGAALIRPAWRQAVHAPARAPA